MEEMLAMARKVDGLDGLELVGNWHINDQNIGKVTKLFRDNGFAIPMIVPDLWTQAKWGRGSLAAADAATRREAVAEVEKCMDWAAEAGCPYVDVWPGQDGFEYAFQADYTDAWKWMREGVAECAAHSKKVKVLVEYKLREPRGHCFLSSVGKAVLLIQGIANTGCLLDVGHSLAAGESMAEAAAFLADYGMLDYLHLNDNGRSWDDDMIFGSVHAAENLELAYWLARSGYAGWLTLDIFPYREEKVPAASESFAWLRTMLERVEERGVESITEIVRRGEGTDSVRLARELLLGPAGRGAQSRAVPGRTGTKDRR
jgi:xylose isomerase